MKFYWLIVFATLFVGCGPDPVIKDLTQRIEDAEYRHGYWKRKISNWGKGTPEWYETNFRATDALNEADDLAMLRLACSNASKEQQQKNLKQHEEKWAEKRKRYQSDTWKGKPF